METELTLDIKDAYRRERKRLLIFIKSKIASAEDAEDILQDVFTNTLQGMSVTQPVENIIGWLYTSARNKIIDWYRKKRIPAYSVLQESDENRISLDDMLSEVRFNPEHAFYRNLLIDEITESLEELPENQKMVFIWNVVEGRSFREISEMTGESVNTLLSRKRYAIQFLRNRLKEINEIIVQMQ